MEGRMLGGSAVSCVGCPAADSIPRAGWDRGVQVSPVCHQRHGGTSRRRRDRSPLAGGDGTPGAAEMPCSARFIWRVLLVCSERPKAEELSGGR